MKFTEKRVLCTVIVALTIILFLVITAFFVTSYRLKREIASYDVVPNSEKYEYNKIYDEYFLTFPKSLTEPVGDGVFCIDYARYNPCLMVRHPQYEYNTCAIVLNCMYDRFFENGILYFYSVDGYAIVYPESNICKVYITSPPKETGIKLSRLENNNYEIMKLTADTYPIYKHIVYMDNFEEFTSYEQKMLKKLNKTDICVR